MLGPLPGPPDWKSPWEAYQEFDWVKAMRGCPQAPLHHAEGDVWIHTGMVLEALVSLPAFRALPEEDRAVVFTAALLHDVAKPACTREGAHDLTTAGHSRRGSILARELLWKAEAPMAPREQVAALIAHHMAPFWLLQEEDPRPRLLRVAQTARCDLLQILSSADARGRICADQARLLEQVELFGELCAEYGVEREPFAFPSDHSRVVYHLQGGDPQRLVFANPRCTVTLMSGLPGAGKDTWVAREADSLPCISLDDLREELGVRSGEHQAAVATRARERARELLRQGQSFVWNATNLSRELRSRCLSLFYDYSAAVHIVYLEASPQELERRSRRRERAVPAAAFQRMLSRWEVPDLCEAHQVSWKLGGHLQADTSPTTRP